MLNQIISREVKKEDKTHRIFSHQRPIDLCELVEILKANNSDSIVINFNGQELNEVIGVLMQEDSQETLKRTREYIATKIIQELAHKNPDLQEFQRDKLIDSFKTEDEYKNGKFPTIIDAIELINIDGSIKRVHFIMNCIRSAILCDAMVPFLKDNIGFGISIYNSPNKFYTSIDPDSKERRYLTEIYDYIEYDEFEEGHPSKKRVKGKTNAKV